VGVDKGGNAVKAEDLPEIFILFFYRGEAPRKFMYLGVGSWCTWVLDSAHLWQMASSVSLEYVLSEWERSAAKYSLIWPEEYGE